jgi:hypothetical protein
MNFRRLIDVPWRRRTQKGVGLRRSKIRSPSAALCSRQANPVHESSQYNSISQGGAALRRASRSILERAEQRELSDKLIPTDPRAAARCGMGFRGAQFRGDGEPAVVPVYVFPQYRRRARKLFDVFLHKRGSNRSVRNTRYPALKNKRPPEIAQNGIGFTKSSRASGSSKQRCATRRKCARS